MAKVITITNQKGGVGKTTTAINLSFYLAKAGKKTLLIDFDPQGNASSGLNIAKDQAHISMSQLLLSQNQAHEAVMPTSVKNLSIIIATPELADTEIKMTQLDNRFTIFRDIIKTLRKDYDYIIIDSPPSLSLITVNCMIAADYLLLPVQTEFYALEGVAQLLESMQLIKKASNPKLQILGVVATMYDKRTSLSAQVLAEIQKYFKNLVFKTTIPRNIRLAEAPSHGVPIGQYDRFSKGAKAYKNLAAEVIERTS